MKFPPTHPQGCYKGCTTLPFVPNPGKVSSIFLDKDDRAEENWAKFFMHNILRPTLGMP